MKVVILAGGFGTRISEESAIRPKPLVEIGGQPILWHIMKIYAAYGLSEFVICGGYKFNAIKQFFRDYMLAHADVTLDLATDQIEVHRCSIEPWKVTLVDTGEHTMTGGRLKRVREYLGERPFCLTYGDGVSDIDVGKLIEFHKKNGRLATVTAVRQPGRFGALSIIPEDDRVRAFREKSNDDGGFINGGFFVLEPEVLKYIPGDDTVWENTPLQSLAHDGELVAYRHNGFWQNMDTLRDRHILEALWSKGEAPWKVW